MDTYKIGVRLALTGNFSDQLAMLATKLTGVNVKVDQLAGGFGKLQKAIVGAVSVFAGEKILGGMAALVAKTKDLSHELTQIEKLGGSANGRAADLRAREITRDVRGITEAQALHIYGQTYGLLGDAHAREVQELLGKYAVAMGNTLGNPERGFSGSRDLVRAAEQMGRLTSGKGGAVDIARFQKFVDLAARIGAATEGQVGAQQLYALTQTAGVPLSNMNDRGIAEMAILSQYMGAHRAGTAITSLNQQFAGGQMWTRNATELERLGILHEGEWKKGGGGGIVLSPEARKRLGNALTDPLQFITSVLVPALDAKGITNTNDQINEIYALFGRQTSQRVIADLLRNRGQIGSEIGRLDKGMNLDQQLKAANAHDVEQALNNLSASWQNLLYAVSQSEPVIEFLNGLTDTVRSVTESIRGTDPAVLKGIAEGIGILGAALVGGGAVAILGAIGVGGWIAAGIVALGGALMLVPWKTVFDGLATGFHKVGDALSWLWDKVKNFFKNIPVPDYGPFGSPTNYEGGAYYQPAMFTTSGGGRAGVANVGRAAASPMARAVGSGNGTSAARFINDMVTKYHWSPEAAAIMAGNVQVESGFNPNSVGDHGTSFGLAQWHLGRNSALRAWAAAHGLPWNSVAAQEGFMDHEWRQRYGGAIGSHDFALLAHLGRRYEGYSTNTFGARVGFAQKFLHQFQHGENSTAIPPARSGELTTHVTMTVDGRTLGKATAKHFVNQGQMPTTGSRLPDYQGTRPQPGLVI